MIKIAAWNDMKTFSMGMRENKILSSEKLCKHTKILVSFHQWVCALNRVRHLLSQFDVARKDFFVPSK